MQQCFQSTENNTYVTQLNTTPAVRIQTMQPGLAGNTKKHCDTSAARAGTFYERIRPCNLYGANNQQGCAPQISARTNQKIQQT